MSKRSKRFLTFLLYVAIVSNFGCATTAREVAPSQAAMDDFEIGKSDDVFVRYANNDIPHNNPKGKLKLCTVFFGVASTIVQLNNITRGDAAGLSATVTSIEHYRSKFERKASRVKNYTVD